MALRSR
ncbi:UNVERIFIED_CONTAM: hypothetical protein GTU68_034393 [Idotea baltica]|nr:hypothetical protein [Idotea baltica]